LNPSFPKATGFSFQHEPHSDFEFTVPRGITVKWLEVKVTYEAPQTDLAADLIADIFYDLGAKGVVMDDSVLDPAQDWGADALPPPPKPAVTAYLPSDDDLGRRCTLLTERLGRLAVQEAVELNIAYGQVDEEDWAESWKVFFYPQKLSDRLVVKPTWRDYVPQEGEQIIEIDPGMAFGTGTHPTTAMCVRLLERHLAAGRSVLDIGTGSGILLIAAARLGAGRLCGVDSDPMAVTVARSNLILNQVESDRFELHCGHLSDSVAGTYDVVVANILADVILDLLEQVGRVLVPGGRLICSGIIASRQSEVHAKMERLGFESIAVEVQDDWVALSGRYPNSLRRNPCVLKT
jgi:ribosomal protein L11 methyltransferase